MIAYLIAVAVVMVFCVAVVGAALLYRNLFGHQIWVRFLQRTGYRRRADPGASIQFQARAVLGEIFRPEGVVRGPWIREVDGQTLTYNSWTYSEGDSGVTEE